MAFQSIDDKFVLSFLAVNFRWHNGPCSPFGMNLVLAESDYTKGNRDVKLKERIRKNGRKRS